MEEKCGWLVKRGHGVIAGLKWRPRWFILRPASNKIEYYHEMDLKEVSSSQQMTVDNLA